MKYIILFTALSLSFTCKADLGTCYCVKSEIEFEDGFMDIAYFKIGGYDFSIHQKDDKYGYWTHESRQLAEWKNLPLKIKSNLDYVLTYDADFSQTILNLISDSLKYHTDYIKLNYKIRSNQHQEIKLIGEKYVISKYEIIKLNIQRLMPCGVGTTIETELESTDKDWISEVIQIDYLGGPEMCGYSSLHFKNPSDEIISLKTNLKETLKKYGEALLNPNQAIEKIRSLQKTINTQINLLKEQQVIIMMRCSC